VSRAAPGQDAGGERRERRAQGMRLLAFRPRWQRNACRATSIAIGDVPDKARDGLAARAAAPGRPLREYLRAKLIGLASHPDVETLLARIAERKERSGTKLPAAEILAGRDAGRRCGPEAELRVSAGRPSGFANSEDGTTSATPCSSSNGFLPDPPRAAIKIMGREHKHVTHSKCYATSREFAGAVLTFLREKVPQNWRDPRDSVTDNFRVVNPRDFRVLS
jgi:antitoxin FitA